MFQTGTLRTKTKYIKMNQGEDDFEIPVPWFLIKHPQGNVVIDGGNAIEAAIDKRGHWGAVVDAYDPIMEVSENCVDQLKMVDVDAAAMCALWCNRTCIWITPAPSAAFPRRSISCSGRNMTMPSSRTGFPPAPISAPISTGRA